MKKIFLILILAFLLTGCSLQDVNVEKPEYISNDVSIVEENNIDGSQSVVSDEKEANEIRPEIGEKFIPEGMVKSGGYLTIDSAEIFDNLNDAGIEEANLLPGSLLLDNGEPREIYNEIANDMSVAYDKNTGNMLNGWKIVKVHYIFENQSAVSIVNDTISIPEEKYADDVFKVGNLNVCNADNSLMVSKMNYFCYNQIFFSLSDSVEYIAKPNNKLFKCPVDEKIEFDIAYVFCCEPENLYMSATSGSKTNTMVDLKLGGDS